MTRKEYEKWAKYKTADTCERCKFSYSWYGGVAKCKNMELTELKNTECRFGKTCAYWEARK